MATLKKQKKEIEKLEKELKTYIFKRFVYKAKSLFNDNIAQWKKDFLSGKITLDTLVHQKKLEV